VLGDGERSVLLDGLVSEPKLGFKLRGRGELAMGSDGMPEHEDTALDESELAWLRAEGYELYVSDVGRYRNWDGDEFTAMLAWVGSIVGFLNDNTAGEDVALGGLLFEREATWPWPVDDVLTRADDVEVADRGQGAQAHTFDLLVRRPTVLTIPCAGPGDLDAPLRLSAFMPEENVPGPIRGSTRGATSVLLFRAGAHALPDAESRARPDMVLRVRQQHEGRELVRESRTFTLFLPSHFDLADPFVVELELAPGRYSFYGPARLGAARLE
jgi:hypothetical protein